MVELWRVALSSAFLFKKEIQSTSLKKNLVFWSMNRRYCVESKINVAVPRGILPSPRLIAKFENKDVFLRLLLEMELLYGSAAARLPTFFSDENWIRYTRITNLIERCCYLHQLFECEQEADRKRKTKVFQASKTGNSDPFPFNTLFQFGREDFRRFAYELFGSRLLASWRCNDSFPPLLIDCAQLHDFSYATQRNVTRQMKDLVLDNSLQRNPFPLIFVNYHITIDHAMNIINSWLRKRCLPKYRPLTVTENGKVNEQVFSERQRCAPFIPVITSATVRECLGSTDSGEIAYISHKAVDFLPGPLTRYKAFVLCATSGEKLMNSSSKTVKAEQLKSYRLPLSKFLNMNQMLVTMPLHITANILRYVYNGCEWKEAFQKHIPYFDVVENLHQNHHNDLNDLQIIKQWISNAERRGRKKQKHVHLYTREERRAAQSVLTEIMMKTQNQDAKN
ncbi:unnamed protein product [Thelazia callipaeda]|uniref:SAM-dependent MTase TRM10-type domain-containing protein n=1 Tax=Thelazia callipaeda TaxID=103827 RepID=A0A0N5D9M7_THECL|nr:unnamed protein product [Thelazia callipaeda]